MTNLDYGALLHDVGKIYNASDILNKTGRVKSLEDQALQMHTENRYDIAREMDLPEVILTLIRQYHKRLDGSGYPGRLKGMISSRKAAFWS